MDDIAEGLFRGLLRVLKWIVIDFLIEIFLYGLGYGTLKLFTFGRYPRANQENEGLCIGTGIAVVILIVVSIGLLNSYYTQTT